MRATYQEVLTLTFHEQFILAGDPLRHRHACRRTPELIRL